MRFAELKNVASKHGIDCLGVVDFSFVKGHLFTCGGVDRLPERAKSVIVMLFPYYIHGCEQRNLARYAVLPDYHAVAGDILNKIARGLKQIHPEYSFVSFADNSPIKEVKTAAHAGLGVIGKNGLLINEKYGSFVFIGEIVTDLDIENTFKESPGECRNCGVCLKKCLSCALSGDGFDRKNCISDISQKKGALTNDEKALIKKSGFVWGCDICQDCCPHNKNIQQSEISSFIRGVKPNLNKTMLPGCADRAFIWRGEEVLLRNLEIFE